MTIVAVGFLVSSGLQLAGLWVIWSVLRDLLRSLGRGRLDRLLEARFGTAERERLLLGTSLFTGGIALMGCCGAITAMAVG